jgi:hypothetical protein
MGLENLPPAKPLSERRKQPYNTVPVQPAEPPSPTVESTPVTEKPDESTDGSGNRDTPVE